MKDWTPILWIAGAVALYFAYQNNWFGNFTVSAPSAIPPATSSPNLVPISTLTPPQPAPVITVLPLPAAPVITATPNIDPVFKCPPNADCGQPLQIQIEGGGCPNCL